MVEKIDLFEKLTNIERNFLESSNLTPEQLDLSAKAKMFCSLNSSPTMEDYDLIKKQFIKKYGEEEFSKDLIDYLFDALGLN